MTGKQFKPLKFITYANPAALSWTFSRNLSIHGWQGKVSRIYVIFTPHGSQLRGDSRPRNSSLAMRFLHKLAICNPIGGLHVHSVYFYVLWYFTIRRFPAGFPATRISRPAPHRDNPTHLAAARTWISRMTTWRRSRVHRCVETDHGYRLCARR